MAESVPIRKLTLQKSKVLLKLMQSSRHWLPLYWPERRAEVNSQLQVYFPVREELSVQDGIVFKGERIIVPPSLRQCMMDKVHYPVTWAFRGASAEPFYWSGIYKQIT